MTEPESIGELELAALISSRICHDVINPVGAIANGLEMLGEEPDEAMQFARLAFGAAGSAGAEIDLRDAEKVARDFVQGKHKLEWQGPAVTLPKNKVKLLLNLVALGVVALPRGGTVRVEISGEPPNVRFIVRASGEVAKLNEQVTSLLAGGNGVVIDAHSIQPYYASRVAAAAGMAVTVVPGQAEIELKAA